MAIIWQNGPQAGEVLYAGHVLEVGTRTIRVMSDVWEDERYAAVWTGTGITTFSLHSSAYVATRTEYFMAVALVDATEEVRAEVAEWRRLNYAIESTIAVLRAAASVGHQKEVEVFKGRKVPLGIYEATSKPWEGAFGITVHLRDKSGNEYRYVNIDNLRVIQPERYVPGAVACSCCRREFSSAIEAGMIAGKYADGVCRECRLEQVLDGKRDIPMPKGAVHSVNSMFRDRPALRDTEGETFIRSLFDDQDDMTTWLVFCDWLEENDDERAEGLRLALVGKPKVKAKPIRKKDLKVSEWKLVSNSGYGLRMFECMISGFPPTENFDLVAVRVVVTRHNGVGKPTFLGRKSDDLVDERYYDHGRRVTGALLRQCKLVVPPLEVPPEVV